jgi:hypothetical protein
MSVTPIALPVLHDPPPAPPARSLDEYYEFLATLADARPARVPCVDPPSGRAGDRIPVRFHIPDAEAPPRASPSGPRTA